MSYNAAYTIGSLSVPGTIIFTDASTGSDPNITGRSIELRLADGSLLGGAAISFPLSEGSIKSITIPADYAINIVFIVTSSAPLPSPSTYTASGLYTFTGFSYQFWDSLIGAISYTYTIVSDTNWLTSAMRLVLDIDNAERAGETSQQTAAQTALADAQFLQNNQNNFF